MAPVLALHCNGCHGDASGFNARSYRDLMKGGNLGKLIVPGDPESSLLVHFVDGRRGEAHRMPLGGRPLSPAQIGILQRWIAEGAQEDVDATNKYELRLPELRSEPLKILCRVPTQSYLRLRVTDQRARVLYTDVVSVKSPKERGDGGAPGDWISWDLTPGKDWPRRITVQLTIAYVESDPVGAELLATRRGGPQQALARMVWSGQSRSP